MGEMGRTRGHLKSRREIRNEFQWRFVFEKIHPPLKEWCEKLTLDLFISGFWILQHGLNHLIKQSILHKDKQSERDKLERNEMLQIGVCYDNVNQEIESLTYTCTNKGRMLRISFSHFHWIID
jgi:hypothetical protein